MRRLLCPAALLGALAAVAPAAAAPALDPAMPLRGRPTLTIDGDLGVAVLRTAAPLPRRADGSIAASVRIDGRRATIGRLGARARSCYTAAVEDARLRPGRRYDVFLTVFGSERNVRSVVAVRATAERLAGASLGC